MSQRITNVDECILINLQLRVDIKSFSNHDGSTDGQIKTAIEEFTDQISRELLHKIANEYHQEEFLQSIDYVSYEVSTNGIQ
jgi:hypothetical protein